MKKKTKSIHCDYKMPLHNRFEVQASLYPKKIALTCKARKVTYDQLNKQANQLAHRLIALQVKPGKLVGITLDRDIELVVAILAVLKAGAAYVPIDPNYPKERIALMIEDCQPTVVISQNKLRSNIDTKDIHILCLDMDSEIAGEPTTNPAVQVGLDDLSHVIYTSGSTGKPKGCLTAHGNVMRLWEESQALFSFKDSDVWTLFHSYSFDFSVWEIWGALLHGGKLVVVPYEISRSPSDFYKLLVRDKVTVLNQTPFAFLQLMQVEKSHTKKLDKLRYIILGGEALNFQSLKTWTDRYGTQSPQIINGYGPTETTIFATFKWINAQDLTGSSISNIGDLIPHLSMQVVNSDLQPVKNGEMGELLIGGAGVARGYLNRSELTAERFIENPNANHLHRRVYRTGDLVRLLDNGQIEYLGRIDTQVKIRGFRIELGEIENLMRSFSGIREAAVALREDEPGEPYLAGYYVTEKKTGIEYSAFRQFLSANLPDYMVPATLTSITSLPHSPNGKLDRNALPKPEQKRPDLSQPYLAAVTDLEHRLVKIWSGLLKIEKVGIDDNFFELGGNSILCTQLIEKVKTELGVELPLVKLFENPTVFGLSTFLDPKFKKELNIFFKAPPEPMDTDEDELNKVAIIGMAGRYPGANNLAELWTNLCAGTEGISFFEDHELDASIPQSQRLRTNYVKARGVIADVDLFDAAFFGIMPHEAEIMDPQHRLFMTTCWQALENAGYAPESQAIVDSGWVGVYGGVYNNTYYSHLLVNRPDLTQRIGDFQTMTSTEKDYVATRVSYKLNLKGPSVTLLTACSTSLVAITNAYHALISQQCELAVAGGASITVPQNSGHEYAEGCMLSNDGHTRPFDGQAKGTVFSDGVGVVVLKRLKDAKRDGDTIYAVIIGAALNNDGGHKMSFTAPSVEGQSSVIARAQAFAKINPESISYVEGHGTATPMGDPIEVEALTQAFRKQTDKKQFCILGSIKGNIGHTTIAAGVAGIIKTALALQNKQIPPTVNYQSSNPNIDFVNSPFYVSNRLMPWPKGKTPRRAGVSSFGIGGTNAHLVMEEFPGQIVSGPSRPHQLLLLSAKSAKALEVMTQNLISDLKDNDEISLADVAFTLQTGRPSFTHRRWVVAETVSGAIDKFQQLPPHYSATSQSEMRSPEVVFMFPGQGSQYIDMGLSLYEYESVFRRAVDLCAQYFSVHLLCDIRQIIYPQSKAKKNAADQLRETRFAQPALFTIEYALAQLWQSWGVQPQAMIGHSVGEFVAATLAGVFSLEDACQLVAHRGLLMQKAPEGSMLAVHLSAQDLKIYLQPGLEIASFNAPQLCVVSGPQLAIEALQQQLNQMGVICNPLQTSHAFHSAMMDSVVPQFANCFATMKLTAPQIPFISTVTGTWITNEQARDPGYWSQHLRVPVLFAQGILKLWEQSSRVLLEVGPRSTLTVLASQSAKNSKKEIAIASLENNPSRNGEWISILKALGDLWQAGVLLNWKSFYMFEKRHRLPLATYPFEQLSYWVQAQTNQEQTNDDLIEETLIAVQKETGVVPMTNRKNKLVTMLQKLFEETYGIETNAYDKTTTFLEMGMDSLLLTQVVNSISQQFNLQITFRQLLEEYSSLELLAEYMDSQLPESYLASPEVQVLPKSEPSVSPAPVAPIASLIMTKPKVDVGSDMENILKQQLELMNRQLDILSGGVVQLSQNQAQTSSTHTQTPIETPEKMPKDVNMNDKSTSDADSTPRSVFGPMVKINPLPSQKKMTPQQQKGLESLINSYCEKTKHSKKMAQDNRSVLADPRIVSGFRPEVKELTYQIHTAKSLGSKLWDVDGNEYVDMTCGFGTNFFGNVPEFIKAAIIDQLNKGMEIGPSLALAGEVARLFSDMTGAERVAFCSTGSEAVLAAIRLARTVTGRRLIVSFTNDYHGLFDEVVVRGNKKLKTIPAAPGIIPSCVENVLVLDYGMPESLQIIRERAGEIAGVLIEPVQSRNPDLQPKAYLKEMRQFTEKENICLIFDEVITGFRVSQGGCQAYFDVTADLGTYGKVIGGGLPMGVVAGKKKWMDALDGGEWQFGDDSAPTVGVTYFAGTYVRHPLALATAKVVLEYLKQNPTVQQELTEKTKQMVHELNTWCQQLGVPIHFAQFASMYKISFTQDFAFSDLLSVYMRERGLHVWDQRPCFLTLAHSTDDIALIIKAFKESVMAMESNEFITFTKSKKPVLVDEPINGARLGRDPHGKPAWYIPDPNCPGKYIEVGAQK